MGNFVKDLSLESPDQIINTDNADPDKLEFHVAQWVGPEPMFTPIAWSMNHDYDRFRRLHIDARNRDGYSTWSAPKLINDFVVTDKQNPFFTLTHYKWTNSEWKNVDGTDVLTLPASHSSSAKLRMHTHTLYKISVQYSSPPAHLHFVLDSWDEFTPNTRPEKTWEVTKVVDADGKDLSQDPDWFYYVDNRMTFQKTQTFVFIPGQLRSDEELDLFGTLQDHEKLYGTYKFSDFNAGGDLILTLSFPDFKEDLTVVSSDYNSVVLRGEHKGKVGVVHLSVVN